MAAAEIENPVDASGATLIGFYVIAGVATTIGICVVALLNLFTPLESLQGQIKFVSGGIGNLSITQIFSRFLPRFMGILIPTYALVFSGMYRLLGPIRKALALKRQGAPIPGMMTEKARRRLINLPFLFLPINVGMWMVIPAAIGSYAVVTGMLDHRTAIILASRAAMIGLIASAIAFHKIEDYSRRSLIPLFFPDGRLTDLTGAAGISISRRIRLASRLGNIVPFTILLVTLLTLQWEVTSTELSAPEYGRGIIGFTLALFVYAFVVSGVLNRAVTKSITRPLTEMTRVIKRVRGGDFNRTVQVVSNDEIGLIGDVVNEMSLGLREREKMRRSLELAREIQQNLLPRATPRIPGMDLAGTAIYCDETGGDYYDFIVPDSPESDVLQVVLGDVSGHGISSALLMATTRAFIRLRSSMPGAIEQVVTDVNRQFARDVRESGSFMTLFYLSINTAARRLNWVRAGHDPAFLYDPGKDRFIELDGPGVALGIDESYIYRSQTQGDLSDGQVITLYTDGVWEAPNRRGEIFGKAQLRTVIRENARRSARDISRAVIRAIQDFQDGVAPEDDVTLLVVKMDGRNW